MSGISIVVAGLIAIFGWGVGADPGKAAFRLAADDAPVTIPVVPAAGRGRGHRAGRRHLPARAVPAGTWLLAAPGEVGRRAVAVLFVVAFLCWAATGTKGTAIDMVGVLSNTIFLATPLILGAMAGILCERTGVINVAIEGQMLAGAFAGALVRSVAKSAGVGLLVRRARRRLMGALLAVFAIKFLVNQVVLGVVLNVLALGLTGYGFDALMQNNPARYNSPVTLPSLPHPRPRRHPGHRRAAVPHQRHRLRDVRS